MKKILVTKKGIEKEREKEREKCVFNQEKRVTQKERESGEN